MKIPLRVLIAEDNENDLLLLLRELRRADYDVIYERVDTAVAMSAALTEKTWDVILSDYSMPQFSALDALRILQEKQLDLPFIIVSGTVGEDAAVAAMKLGAHDFFPKAKLTRLIPAIERERREAEERQQRRLVEQQLHQSEERFTRVFRASPIGFSIMTNEGVLLDVNEQFLNLFGGQQQDVIGKTLLEIAVWSDAARSRVKQIISQPNLMSDLDVECQTQSGEIRDILISFESIELDNDVRKLVLFHDITARKQAQNELNALYNATSYLFNADSLLSLGQQIVQAVTKEFAQFDCGLLLVDKDHNRMVRLARGGEQRIYTEAPLYLDGEGLVPRAVSTGNIIYVPDVSADQHYVPNDFRTRSELVVPLRTAKGILGVLDLQSMRLNAFSESDQRILAAFAERAGAAIESMQLYEEINRHAAELEWRVAQRTNELRQAKEHVEAILNNSSDAIILVGTNGLIQQTNQAFSDLFGYSSDQVYKQPLVKFFTPDQSAPLTNALQMIIEDEQPPRIETVVHREDNTTFNADMAFASVMDEKGAALNIICSVRDVTQHKQIEEGLRASLLKERELNELKSRFVSMVSHEFRTPLSVIQSSTDLVTRYSDRMTEERKKDHLEQIEVQVKRLTGLLDEVLMLSKAETVGLDFNPTIVELEALCQIMIQDIQLTAEDRMLIFNFTPDSAPAILIDPKLIRQAVTNLLSNAVKYSPPKSRIWLNVSFENHSVVFRVKDEGIGIPEEDQKRIFEIFHRASNVGTIPGTGLGLAIVKQSIEAHGGTMALESLPGQGTTFTLSIPLVPA